MHPDLTDTNRYRVCDITMAAIADLLVWDTGEKGLLLPLKNFFLLPGSSQHSHKVAGVLFFYENSFTLGLLVAKFI